MVVKSTPLQTDITIIGAGIVGLTTAILLKKSFPQSKVLVLEQSLIGSGASFYGGAADVPFALSKPHRDLIDLGRIARSKHPEIITPSFDTLTYWIAEQQDINDLYNAIWPNDLLPMLHLDLHGFPVRLLSTQRIFYSHQGSVGSPYMACKILMQRIGEMIEASIIEGLKVVGIEQGYDGKLHIDSACGHCIHSRIVILAVGPWLAQFSMLIPEGVRINTKKIIAFHINLPTQAPHFCIHYFLPDMYFIPDPLYSNRWIFCIRSEEWGCLPEAGALHISADEFKCARALLDQYAPSLNSHLQGGRVFCDAYQSDFQPYINRHPDMDNLIIAGACSGSGYRLSAGIAQRVQDILESLNYG
jgi:glycine/D-amino acid oxidase-like deaminating enzyme